MVKKKLFVGFVLFCSTLHISLAQQVSITINADQNRRFVSPYLYGRNNNFDKPASFYKDAGLRFARTNGGNNATKYNWSKKITSHPDWYNNVYYSNDWDKVSLQVAADHPDMQVMWAFQLLGRVASSTSHNFNDWGYNGSQYWSGVNQNLAGGGVLNPNGNHKALMEGNANLYTQAWPADSSVAILDHWFGPKGLGLNKKQFQYWSMDNEPEIWNGTHDDVMPTLIPASAFMDRFIELAKKARAKFPEIKICGPVPANEWQWYKWGSEGITISGRYYCWLEYFIKRCADEKKASGQSVLDVVDIHSYPSFASNADALQSHRMYFDANYDFPGANGLRTITGGWNTSLTKEYIFKRINGWLDEHFGPNHGITLGLSEWSPGPSDPNLASVIYASHLGEFTNNGVEVFSPWTWYNGMWETLHLFSRYAKNHSVSSASSNESTVSAYTTVNSAVDSMTVMIVNRDMNNSRTISVNLNGFMVKNGNFKTLQLSALPTSETFVSHTQNALKENQVTVNSNSFSITVPKLSTTAVLLAKSTTTAVKPDVDDLGYKIFPNPFVKSFNIEAPDRSKILKVSVIDLHGKLVETIQNPGGLSNITVGNHLASGMYIVRIEGVNGLKTFRIIKVN